MAMNHPRWWQMSPRELAEYIGERFFQPRSTQGVHMVAKAIGGEKLPQQKCPPQVQPIFAYFLAACKK
jgi:hypothetical protein